jgi:hypothetical protein
MIVLARANRNLTDRQHTVSHELLSWVYTCEGLQPARAGATEKRKLRKLRCCGISYQEAHTEDTEDLVRIIANCKECELAIEV